MDVLPKKEVEVVPFDLVPLPSKGRLYSDDHPFHNQDKVEIKAMTTEEENILNSPALVKKGTALTELIKACLINKLVEPGSLLVGDKTAILLAIRISGFTHQYRVETVCPECNKDFEHTFDLSQIKLKPLGAEPVATGKNLFEFVLPHSERKVLFSLLTDAEDMDVTKAQENRRKITKSDVDKTGQERLIRCIKKIGNVEDPAEVAKLVRSMRALDARALRSYISKIEPDVIFQQEVECVYCSETKEHPIPIGIEFFWPSLD